MAIPNPIPFTKVIEALLDESVPFSPRYLSRLSDIEPDDKAQLEETWPKISLRRREALLEDMDEIHMADTLMYFDEVARIALKDEQPSVRLLAIQILREYEPRDLLKTFMQISENDPDAEVRAASTAALSFFIYLGEIEELSPEKLVRVEEFLLNRYNSSDTKLVRRRALEALGFSSRKELPPMIEQAYASPDVDWLITAVFAMGRSANQHWNPQVLKMLDHPNPQVRAEAAGAAGELELKDALPRMLELLKDDDSDVRLATIWALSQIGGIGVRETLENLLETTEDSEEEALLENALENLDFTEEIQDLAILDLPEDGDEPDDSSDDDNLDDIDEITSEDDEG